MPKNPSLSRAFDRLFDQYDRRRTGILSFDQVVALINDICRKRTGKGHMFNRITVAEMLSNLGFNLEGLNKDQFYWFFSSL
jgi:hypothetical protein